jgi:hypothetical protein
MTSHKLFKNVCLEMIRSAVHWGGGGGVMPSLTGTGNAARAARYPCASITGGFRTASILLDTIISHLQPPLILQPS